MTGGTEEESYQTKLNGVTVGTISQYQTKLNGVTVDTSVHTRM